jgi:hypothetical protein
MKQLETNSRDRLVSVAKAAAGALPFIGSLSLSKKYVILTLNREYIHEIYADLWYTVVNELATNLLEAYRWRDTSSMTTIS